MAEAETTEKWSGHKFFIGVAKLFINMATVSWAVYTFIAYKILQNIFIASNGELTAYLTSPVMIIMVSGWVVVSVIMGCNLQKAFSTMIENAKINAELKAGIQTNVNTETSKVIEAIKNISTKDGGKN
jgi:hypothetical protein